MSLFVGRPPRRAIVVASQARRSSRRVMEMGHDPGAAEGARRLTALLDRFASFAKAKGRRV